MRDDRAGGLQTGYGYDAAGQLTELREAANPAVKQARYRYDGLVGQQVRRYQSATDPDQRYYLYDEAGRWLGEYGLNGAPKRQIVWLDDLPVGLIDAGGAKYIEPDHLGTPRAVIDPVRDVAVWTWDAKGEAFGNSPPHEDPDADGTALVFDMRFPGQRHDAATGLHYNYFRDYDPATGQYVQSDPIGLGGGISTYAYVAGDPISYGDPYGLSKFDKLFGLPKQFWNWYHRRVKKPGDRDIGREEAEALHKEWKDAGCPTPDSKKRGRNNQSGSADLGLLGWMIPWQITPVEMGCAELDCDRNGKPDFLEASNPKDDL